MIKCYYDKMKFMKYLIIFLISFTLAFPAYAAKLVPGTVPVVHPLQPAAVGISANVKNNVQASSPQNGQVSGSSVAGQNSPTAVQPPAQQQTLPASAVPYKTSSPWLWWLLIIVGLALLVWWLKGQRKV